MPVCLTCNSANPDGSRFCNDCGANLQKHSQSPLMKRKKAAFKVAAMVVVVCGCFILIIVSNRQLPQSSSSVRVRPVSSVQDEAAEREWIPVRDSLIRLESGIEHETQILLRTSIANAAAQLDIYARGGAMRPREARVISARLSIKHLEAAMAATDSVQNTSPYQLGRWNAAALDEVNGSLLVVKCDTAGKLLVGGLRQAHMQAVGVYLNQALDQDSAAKITPASFTVLERRCADEKAARTLVEAEKVREYLKRWPLQIDIVSDRSVEAIVTVDGHRKPFMMLLFEEKTHFAAHESVIIEPTESCELLVSANGKQSRINYDRASSTPLKLALQ
jgi:hypothetical protein